MTDSKYFYQYMAMTRPNEVMALIKSYGFNILNVNSQADLSVVLEKFCSEVGEEALLKLAAIHPDKDLLQTYFEETNTSLDSSPVNTSSSKNSTCSCASCSSGGKCKTLSATSDAGNTFHLSHNQQTFLMAAGLIVLAAIILK